MAELVEKKPQPRPHSPALAAALSVLPGLGHLYVGYRQRGLSILITIAVLFALTYWRKDTVLLRVGELALPTSILFLAIPLLWLWALWDAYRLAGGGRARAGLPVIISALVIYAIGWQVTNIDLGKLIREWADVQPFVASLLSPDFLERAVERMDVKARVEVPCSASPPPPAQPGEGQPYLVLSRTCGEVGDVLRVEGYDAWPGARTDLWWVNPIGQGFRLRYEREPVIVETDAQGRFSAEIEIPAAIPGAHDVGSQIHRIEARLERESGGLRFTTTFFQVVEKVTETVFLALMATTVALFMAIPLSFLAARNLMGDFPLTRAIYYGVRTAFNIFRSIEPLVLAVVFVVWVGLGPFAGVLALAIHSIAALGKLYSEAVEGVDPGPIEAITATGANRLQVIAYGIIPQIVPPFVSFTIYRWDINVRMSTVIGLVGGGGIGTLLMQWINLFQWPQTAAALWAITIVVAAMDYLSAIVREKVV